MSTAEQATGELERLSEHLYRYEDTCNAYAVVEGEAALVVDPGSGAIREALESVGVEEVEWALHTHHHRDQCWGTGDLAADGTRVAVPEYERHLFADVESFWETKRVYDNYNDRSTFFTLSESVPVDATLDDYDTFAWRGYEFDVLPAKGHTLGSSMLVGEVDGRRVAFTGDLLHEGGTLYHLHAMEYGYGDLKGIPFTIQSARALDREDPDLALPSHGGVIDDPSGDVERLVARLMEVVDLGRGLSAGTRAYLPEMEMVTVSPHLLFGGPWTCSNFYVITSESGKGLFVDYGHSLAEHMHTGADREDMETMRFVEHHLEELRTRHGIEEFDVVVPTHIHDDHTSGIPHLQEHYDVECWALDEVGKVLEEPAAWSSTPCLYDEPIEVSRRFEDGDSFEWEEYEFDVYHAPGQTEFHSVLATEIDGRRVAFTGDNYMQHQVDVHYDKQETRPYQTTVMRNSFQFWMHRKCANVMETVQPERICPGHGDVLDVDPLQIQTYTEFIEQKEEAFRDAVADPAAQNVDLFWARLLPYQASAAPGEIVAYTLKLRNNYDEETRYDVRLRWPGGNVVAEGATVLAAGERGDLSLSAAVPADTDGGRQVVTGEVIVDGDSKGPVVEAIVSVGE